MAPSLKAFGHTVIDAMLNYGLTVGPDDFRMNDLLGALSVIHGNAHIAWNEAAALVTYWRESASRSVN